MNKLLLLLTGMISFMVQAFAQQVPLYNHSLQNPFVYNPSMAGFSGDINTYFVRNQRFMGINEGGINNHLSVEGATTNKKFGFGMMASHQSLNAFKQLYAGGTFAYNQKIAEDHFIRIGVTAGYLDNYIDQTTFNPETVNDPYLNAMRLNKAALDVNVGLSYNWKQLTIGVAIPQLITTKINLSRTDYEAYYRLLGHYMLTANYGIEFGMDKKMVIRPNGILRYLPNAPIQYDAGLQFEYKPLGWIGAHYKSNYAVQLNIGFAIKDRFMVGYSYEYILNDIKHYYSGMNHEIMVGLRFKNKPEVQSPKVDNTQKLENMRLKEQMNHLQKEYDELKDRHDRQLKADSLRNSFENKAKENLDSLKKVEEAKAAAENRPMITKGYTFQEIDGTDSPNGFYVISGVFSNFDNAQGVLTTLQEKFPEATLIRNKKNNLYYVNISYHTTRAEADSKMEKFLNANLGKAWVLHYISH